MKATRVGFSMSRTSLRKEDAESCTTGEFFGKRAAKVASGKAMRTHRRRRNDGAEGAPVTAILEMNGCEQGKKSRREESQKSTELQDTGHATFWHLRLSIGVGSTSPQIIEQRDWIIATALDTYYNLATLPRSTFFCTFPVLVFGSSWTKSIHSGTANPLILVLQNFLISSALGRGP